jgi:hypothetical protein
MTTEVYEDQGVHFEYPSDWRLEVSDDGSATTVEVEAPNGLAFAWVRVDESRPDPAGVADEVLAAMRQEYPDLDAVPAMENLHKHRATGHDVEFFSLDFANAAMIRCFRTPRRTVMVFGQWSDLGGDNLPGLVRGVFRSVEELDDRCDHGQTRRAGPPGSVVRRRGLEHDRTNPRSTDVRPRIDFDGVLPSPSQEPSPDSRKRSRRGGSGGSVADNRGKAFDEWESGRRNLPGGENRFPGDDEME